MPRLDFIVWVLKENRVKEQGIRIRTCSDTPTNNVWQAIIHFQHSLTHYINYNF